MSVHAAHELLSPRHQMFPVLTDTEIARMCRFGTLHTHPVGTSLISAGQPSPGIFVMLSSIVAVSQRDGLGHVTPIVQEGRGHFIGEGGSRSGKPSLVDAVAIESAEVLLLLSGQLRALIIALADLGERLVRALILRRVALIDAGAQWARVICPYTAASFNFLSARTLTLVVAGLAANSRSNFVKGSMPVRFFLAGTCSAVIFIKPGQVNSPRPFLWREASTAPSSAASTALAAFTSWPACSARYATSDVLLNAVLIGLSAVAGLATGAVLWAAGEGVFFAVAMRSGILVEWKHRGCGAGRFYEGAWQWHAPEGVAASSRSHAMRTATSSRCALRSAGLTSTRG